MSQVTIEQAIQLAAAQLQAGKLADAESICRQILAVQANQPYALHLLARIASQVGHYDVAMDLIQQAIAAAPDNPDLFVDFGTLLKRQGQGVQAIAAFEQALVLKPDHSEARNNLGNALKDAGKLEQAIACYERAIAARPDCAEIYFNLGTAWKEKCDGEKAIACYEKAISLKPDFAEAWNNLGAVLADRRQLDRAMTSYQRALSLRPDFVDALSNLANARNNQGDFEQAIECCTKALAIKPDFMDAYSNLVVALIGSGQFDQAIDCCQKALAIRPDLARLHNNLGAALLEKGQIDQAIAAYQRAIEIDPNYPAAHSNLGSVFKDNGQLNEAMACYRQALKLKPDFAAAHSNLLFAMEYHPDAEPVKMAEEQKRWNQQHAAPLARLIQPHANDRDPNRKLRVGYVSSDFRDQAECFFVLPLLENHDRRQFEIHCYSSVTRPDAITARFHNSADVWHDVYAKTDSELADEIRHDEIDVLIDLTMHMAHNRMLLFARKPAPVQMTWLAYPGSTGLEAMDYRFTDSYLDPVGTDFTIYSEQSIRLPDCWVCYDPLSEPEIPVRNANGAIRFGSMNNPCKMNEAILRLWADVLQNVSDSRLLLMVNSESHQLRITRLLDESGVNENRLDFVGRCARGEYLKRYEQIDVCLDTLPYNGITTTCDALWMGVPVVTLTGRTAAGRAGQGILSTIGLPELVANTPEEFVEKALQLAGDSSRRADLRCNLRQRMQDSPLMDAARFARNVENAYRTAWRNWCEAQPPLG